MAGLRCLTARLARLSRLPLVLPLALMIALALPAPANEDDVGFLTRTLQGFLSDAGREVRIRGFEGALSSRATMQEMTIADDEGVWLVIRDATLDWDRSALLSRRIEVNQLTAGRIEVLRPPIGADTGADLPSPTARAPFSLPELPVSIRIGRVSAETVVLGAPILGEEAAFRLDGGAQLEGGQGQARIEAVRIDGGEGEFRLSGAFDNTSRQLALDLTLAEGPGGIAATLLNIPDRPALALTARGDDPIGAFRADIGLATDGQPRVSGAVTFLDTSASDGGQSGAVFRLDIGGDLRPLLAPELHAFFGPESRLQAEGARDEAGAIALRELQATTQALALRGEADLGPDGTPRRIDLRLDIAGEGGASVVLPGTDGSGRLRDATLRVQFDAAVSPDWSVLGHLNALALPELAIGQVALDARGYLGLVDADRRADAPDFDGFFEFAALDIVAADPDLRAALGSELYGMVSMVAPGGGAPFRFTGMTLEGETIVMTGSGELDGLEFDGYLEGEVPDFAPFSGLAGRALGGSALIELRGRVHPLTGALDAEASLTTTDLSLNIPEADNLLAGRAGITLSARRDTEGTDLRRLTVQAGTLGLSADGRIRPGDVTTLNARFRLSDLARLGSGYGGALGLDLTYREAEGVRRATLAGEVSDLALADQPGAAQIAGLFQGVTRLDGQIAENNGTVRIERLSLSGGQLALSATGVLSDEAQVLAMNLQRLLLDPLMPGLSGTLTGQADLSGSPGARRIELDLGSVGALRSGQAPVDALLARGLTLRAEGREDGQDLILDSARLTAAGLDVTASGAQRGDGSLSLVLDGGIDGIGRLVQGLEGAARIAARLDRPAGAQDIAANLTLTGPSQLLLSAQGQIRADQQLAMTIQGGVDAGIANPFIAPATVQGQVSVNGTLNGPAALSSLRLAARLTDGRYILPGVGVSFTGIAAEADLAGGRAQIRVNGQSMRGGNIAVDGAIDLNGTPTADLRATASQFRIVQPRLFEGSVSGSVQLRGPLTTGPTVTGTIGIDEVEIRIPNSPLGRTGFVPTGIRHVGETATSRRTREAAGLTEAAAREGPDRRTPIFLDLVLEAPGRVFVRGRGLDAELGGRLQLSGTTLDTIPSGAFTLIRGRLDLLGNRFTLTDGSASLMGSFMPFVRLVASTDSGGVVTSIVLEGPATEPEIRFESVPELPEDEVLARLIFGRSLATLSPFQAAQLAMSVATLTGRSESSFLDRTRNALGLDDLDITTDDEGNTALRAGRYIGENVYADVGVNSRGQSEVRLQLDLTPSLTLRGRTDTTGRSSVGVFFERDY